jgi:uncharacterized membrane protein
MEKLHFSTLKWILSASLAFSCVFICYLGDWALGLNGWEAPKWVVFVGRFHPAVLHLPIGFFTLAMMIDVLRCFSWSEKLPNTSGLMALVSVSAILSCLHGVLLFAGEDYGSSDLARRHLVGGCAFAVLSTIIFLLKFWISDERGPRRATTLFMSLAFMVMSLAGHDGASMTHGSDYLFQFAPSSFKKWMGDEVKQAVDNSVPIKERDIYEVAIEPIVKQSCVQCHRLEKSSGRLRMDSYAMFKKGGKNGTPWVPGDAESSLFLQRIHLPQSDEKHMPPSDRPQLTLDQVAILEWWTGLGGPEFGALESFAPSVEMLDTIRAQHQGDELGDQSEATIVDLSHLKIRVDVFNAKLRGRLSFLQAGEPSLYYDCFDDPSLVDDEVLSDLMVFAPHLKEIHLNHSRVSPSVLTTFLKDCGSVERVALNGCDVDDSCVDSFLACKGLKSISLMDTRFSNSGLFSLIKHPLIRNIYVSRSDVTPEGKRVALARLRQPQINLGYAE